MVAHAWVIFYTYHYYVHYLLAYISILSIENEIWRRVMEAAGKLACISPILNNKISLE